MTHGGAAVYVELLGRARAHIGPARVDFLADKRYWLLAYLAYSDSWVSRDGLAYLFWPDKRTDEAKQDLRGLIKRVRALAWVTGLETRRHGLRWEVRTAVAAFWKALEDDQPSVALALYRGPLLKGLDSYDAVEFSTWLALEREHLHVSWRRALLQRADELQRQGQERQAADLLGTLLEQDELDEEALRAYLGAAARAGQPQEALHAYRSFARKLREELDLEPTAATLDLIEAVKVQKPTLGDRTTSHPVTSFVGRDVELRELTALLARPQCRLLTLTGPGGVGKSCLALQAVGELKRRYPEGAYFISLEALSAPESIVPTLAETLGVASQDDPLGQLIRHVGERSMLLALDNFEHLLKGAALASRLVGSCPNLKLLITSRERLDLHEEWILPVEGLPFPARGDLSPEEALSFDAVRLFVERAQRVRPEFRLTETDLPHIVRICGLVDGFPLGLELAAVWVRIITCAAIVREIEANLDFLATPTRDLPERQKSLRATFEHSWKLLTAREQEIFSNLSVFQGGFTQEAAAVVAGAPLAILASLLDKSLLRVSLQGRYDRHPLLYRYSQEKLAEMPEEQAKTQEKHGSYYLSFLQEDSRPGLTEELENIRAAWCWASAAGKVAELQLAVRPLTSFFEREARYQEGIDLLAEAAGRLEANAHHRPVLGQVLVAQACLYRWLGRHKEAGRLARRGLALLQEGWAAVLGLETLGFVASFTGHASSARHYWREALQLARREGDPFRRAELASLLGWVEACLGNHARAQRHLREALTLTRGVKDAKVVYTLVNVGSTETALGTPQRARRSLEKGLRIARELGERRYLPQLLYALGEAGYELEDYPRVQALGQEALALAGESGNLLVVCWALALLGRTAGALGDDFQAHAQLIKSLRLAWSLKNRASVVFVLVLFAELWLRQGNEAQAAQALQVALGDPAASQTTKALIQRLLDQSKPPGDEAPSLEAVVKRILHRARL